MTGAGQGGEAADLVAGEPRAVLREALLGIATQRRADGSLELAGELPPRLGDPFARALERVADELHADDVRRGGEVREGGQLQAAAFMALLLRVADTS